MSEYTPTTEEVRQLVHEEGTAATTYMTAEDFDRWLAEVKAQAWEEGYKQGSSDNYGSSSDVQYADNPYRQGEEQ